MNYVKIRFVLLISILLVCTQTASASWLDDPFGPSKSSVCEQFGCQNGEKSWLEGTVDFAVDFLNPPTIEEQVNRVALAMAYIRFNNTMTRHMPLSADAKWLNAMNAKSSKMLDKKIEGLLQQDPYFATLSYTHPNRAKNKNTFGVLTSIFGSKSPEHVVYQYMLSLYTEKSLPDPFALPSDVGNFLEFKKARTKAVEATGSRAYGTLAEAVISLMPRRFQRDLKRAERELQIAYKKVLTAKQKAAEYDTYLKSGQDRNKKPLTAKKRNFYQEQKAALQQRITGYKKSADQKENIYFSKLAKAKTAIQKSLDLSKENVKLACRIEQLTGQMDSFLTNAGKLLTVASGNIISRHLIENSPAELKYLAKKAINVPPAKQKLFKERVMRLTSNMVFLLPDVMMGIYYGEKQLTLSSKYSELAKVIIDGYTAKNG